MKKNMLAVLLLICSGSLFANVRLPKIFGDNMVLQRDRTIMIWGWADPKEKVTVKLNNQTKTATADKTGKWIVKLDAEQAGGPYVLNVKGKNEISFQNVLMGDVWVCSGQSNMEFTVRNAKDAAREIKEANFPQIRHFKVPNTVASTPQTDIPGGEWKICTPETVADFSAVGYFFAREIVKEMNVAVGLLNTSWGGTHVETWTSREAFEQSDEFKTMIAAMPRLNFDSLSKQQSAETKRRIENIQGPLDISDMASWKEQSYNDASWKTMNVPGLWEQQALGEFDGTVWFRKTVEVAAADANREFVINLAMIDDADETYVNGIKVGSINGYSVPRKYIIPAGTIKAGKNTIVVKVNDTGGGGGMYGEASNINLTSGAFTIPLSGAWKFRVSALAPGSTSVGPNSYPTLLYNAMVNPLIPYGIKGVLWYQGESNAGRANQYSKAFPLMITDWRKRWNEGDFPFYFVQLASYNAGNGNSARGSNWAELREAQTATLSLPNTGMSITTDIGETSDIHPKNKQDVGKRLAAIALHDTYGKNNVSNGPAFQSMVVDGNRIILSFTGTGSGLMAKDKYGYLKGFEIAGQDQQFKYARAYIDGDKIIVFQDGVTNPVAVRFGWADDAGDNNLYNKEGFPALPFRTDKWKGITTETKYKIGS